MGISHNLKTKVGKSVTVLARISDPFNNYSPFLLTSTTSGENTTYNVSSITYDLLYKGDEGWETISSNVSVAVTAVKTAMAKGGKWKCDDVGYNFEVSLSNLFSTVGEYTIKFLITPTDETISPIVFNQNVIVEE